jgi:demethylmenaquinone methyltransferase / 2-methoxy-6-polyprenyl-1,4-benzoquinol methylase
VAAAQGEPILDMPVGTAYFTVDIARAHDGIVVGADIAPGMVLRAAENARSAGAANLFAVGADAHALPFADASFGAVMCHNGLQVIPGLAPALSELARVVAPGGMLYVSVVHTPLGAALPRRAAKHLPTVFRSGHDVAEEIEAAGFTVTAFERNRLAYLLEAVRTL